VGILPLLLYGGYAKFRIGGLRQKKAPPGVASEWIVQQNEDPMTDEVSILAYVENDDGAQVGLGC
jgi:hypothetical protein